MKAGAARSDITPFASTELSGFVNRVQPAVGTHDPLFANALYVEEGDTRLAWIHADLIGFERDFVRDIRPGLAETARVILSATHTHSGPPTIRLFGCGDYDTEYLARLADRLPTGIGDALRAAEPCECLFGEDRCELPVYRRRAGAPPADPTVSAVSFRRGDGSLAAVVAHFAMHPVALGSDNRLVSGDVMGRAAALASRELPGRPVVLLLNGATGDVNPPSEQPDFGVLERWASELAEAVERAVGGSVPEEGLAFAEEEAEIAVEPLSAYEVTERARRLRPAFERGNERFAERRLVALDAWSRKMLALSDEERAAPLPLALRAVRLGRTVFACFGAEVFAAMQPDLCGRTGERVRVVGYANGDLGYLAPADEYEAGGYEIEHAHVYYGSPPIARGGFEHAAGVTARLIERVR